MSAVLKTVDDKFDNFMKNRDDIKRATKQIFAQADLNRDGVLQMNEVIQACDAVVEHVQAPLEDYGIKISKLSEDQIHKIVMESDINHDQKLSLEEFEEFYVKLLKLMAVKFLKGFSKRYGLGILAGIVGVTAARNIVKTIPIVSAAAAPVLPLLPVAIIGPVLGIAATYGLEKGDLMAARKKLFPGKQQEQKQQ